MSEPTDRWRIDLGYDGAAFSGWAAQPDRRTVQGELEHWLGRILRMDPAPTLVCAGRTDAGVHARGQVAHVDLPADLARAGDDLQRRLCRVLPADLVVHAVRRAPAGFDARFSAIWRRYCYRVHPGPTPPDPLLRNQVVHVLEPLDLTIMNACGQDLLGLRDFAPFCRRRDGATTIRTLLRLEATAVDSGPFKGVIEFTVVADAFCHSMVRSLIGAMTAVGSGRRNRSWLQSIMQSPVRESSVMVMPPDGLTLEEVGYPDDDQLQVRATEARAVRELLDG